MRVLFIPAWHPTRSNPTGGVYIQKQAEAVAELGCETGLIFFQNLFFEGFFDEKWGLFESEKNGVREIRQRGFWPFPKKNERLLRFWVSSHDALFERFCARFGRPDLIHAQGLQAVFVAERLAEKHAVPFVFTEHASAFRIGAVPDWQFPLIRRAWSKAQKLIAVSEPMRDDMARVWPEGRAKIEVVPNLFSGDFFEESRFWSKKKLPEPPVFLTVGGLEPKKAHDRLIEAMAILASKHGLRPRLKIIGFGPLERQLLAQKRESPCAEQIEMTRFVESIGEEFLAADFFVLSSRHETFAVVAAEALASGLPVVATRCGGPEFFVDEKSGIIVEPDDAEKLADGMAELFLKNEKWDRAAISKRAHEQFSARAVGSRLVEIYGEVLREKRVF